eukprot:747818-Hanusia_phi.AAC.1
MFKSPGDHKLFKLVERDNGPSAEEGFHEQSPRGGCIVRTIGTQQPIACRIVAGRINVGNLG